MLSSKKDLRVLGQVAKFHKKQSLARTLGLYMKEPQAGRGGARTPLLMIKYKKPGQKEVPPNGVLFPTKYMILYETFCWFPKWFSKLISSTQLGRTSSW
jgi:hypothetical protein